MTENTSPEKWLEQYYVALHADIALHPDLYAHAITPTLHTAEEHQALQTLLDKHRAIAAFQKPEALTKAEQDIECQLATWYLQHRCSETEARQFVLMMLRILAAKAG